MHSYEHTTKGHWYGHWFRRLVHVSIILVPFIYYDVMPWLSALCQLTAPQFIAVLLGLVAAGEAIRLSTGMVLFGQRKHEARRVSSFGWGALGISLVLWCAPSRAFASAIIWSLALGDPCLGEARRHLNAASAFLIGLLVVLAVWWFCSVHFGISYLWGLWMAPISVLAEWRSFRWVDDNLLMLLVPLAVVLGAQLALH